MKRNSRILAVLMVLALVVSLGSITAFAEGEGQTITIANGVVGETYSAYKIFDVTIAENAQVGTDGTGFAYSITTDSEWWETVTGKTKANAGTVEFTANGLKFTPTTEDGKWTVATAEGFSPATFAAVLAAAVEGKTAAGSVTYSDTDNKISVDKLGYYFVTTSLGSLCSLDTTHNNVNIYEKNTQPSIEKKVKESSDAAYDKVADADVGGTVNYQLTVNTGSKVGVTDSNVDELPLGTGVDSFYTIVDEIPAGIEFITGSVEVKVGEVVWAPVDDYTVNYADGTLTIVLGKENNVETKLAQLGADVDIIITYNATVTGDVAIDAANTNTATLFYKEQRSESTAKVYSWSFDVLKYTGVLNDEYTPLADATFTLSKAPAEGATEAPAVLKFIKVSDTEYLYDARVQDAAITAPDDTTAEVIIVDAITTTSTGTFVIKGLDEGEYIMTETAAPAGYNTLKAPVPVTIVSTADGTDEGMILTKTVKDATPVGDGNYIAVLNNSGTELPSTGGIGTTIFYIVGSILVVVAGVLLVVKKRMGADK